MTSIPTLSIVTPVLNNRRYVRQAIESVLSQEGDFHVQYIIKDGGSTDGTLDVIGEYAEDPRVTVIQGRDRSLYDAVRIGYEHATGEFGGFLCSDDFYAEGAFGKVVAAFSEYPDRDWLYGRCDIVDERSRPIRNAITAFKNAAGFWYSRWLLGCLNYVNTPASFWRRRAWHASGGITDEYRYASDYAFWMAVSSLTKGIPLHDHLASFRRAGESISDTYYRDQFDEELRIARKHTGPVGYAVHRMVVRAIVAIYSALDRKRRCSCGRCQS